MVDYGRLPIELFRSGEPHGSHQPLGCGKKLHRTGPVVSPMIPKANTDSVPLRLYPELTVPGWKGINYVRSFVVGRAWFLQCLQRFQYRATSPVIFQDVQDFGTTVDHDTYNSYERVFNTIVR